MWSWLDAFMGAGTVLLTGIVTVAFMVFRDVKSTRQPKSPICGCEHHASFHDETGRCHFEDHYHRYSCGCVQYLGPVWQHLLP